jgi:hypothetical protein
MNSLKNSLFLVVFSCCFIALKPLLAIPPLIILVLFTSYSIKKNENSQNLRKPIFKGLDGYIIYLQKYAIYITRSLKQGFSDTIKSEQKKSAIINF